MAGHRKRPNGRRDNHHFLWPCGRTDHSHGASRCGRSGGSRYQYFVAEVSPWRIPRSLIRLNKGVAMMIFFLFLQINVDLDDLRNIH